MNLFFGGVYVGDNLRIECFDAYLQNTNALMQIISSSFTTFKYRHFHHLWHLSCRLELIYVYGFTNEKKYPTNKREGIARTFKRLIV